MSGHVEYACEVKIYAKFRSQNLKARAPMRVYLKKDNINMYLINTTLKLI
jgi:hypothetical protein